MAQVNLKDPSKVTLVKGDSGTAEPKVGTNPTPQINYTFSRDDIRKLADERIAQAKEEGEFDDGIEANPTLAGTESALTGLKVNNVKYKVEQPINVAANPTLAGTEAELSGLEVGSTKYKVPQPTEVVANPTLAGTEAALEGLQVGSTKYKLGGGGENHLFKLSLDQQNDGIQIFYLTDKDSFASIDEILTDLNTAATLSKVFVLGSKCKSDGTILVAKGTGGKYSPTQITINFNIYTPTIDLTTGALSWSQSSGAERLTVYSFGKRF